MRKRSSKFPNEIFHTKFDLLYFVKEMFNGKEIRHAQAPQFLYSKSSRNGRNRWVVEKIDVLA